MATLSAGLPPCQQWIVGICSVVFDIDVGQRVEHLVPAECLTKEEQQDVSFHSFPDSMSMELHARSSIKDSTFFFRIRRRGQPNTAQTEGSSAAAHATTNGSGPEGANGHSNRTSEGSAHSGWAGQERFLYGFVFCRQRQDASLRRGGEQQSVVVLAEHPLSAALGPLAAVAGQQYFSALGQGKAQGQAALQQVYDAVSRWPAPVAGPQLQLPVGLTTLTARLPTLHTLPHPSAVTAPEQYAPNAASLLQAGRSPSARSLTGASRKALGAPQSQFGSQAALPGAALLDEGPFRSGSLLAGGLSPMGSNASGSLPASQLQGPLPQGLSAAATADASPFSNPATQSQAVKAGAAGVPPRPLPSPGAAPQPSTALPADADPHRRPSQPSNTNATAAGGGGTAANDASASGISARGFSGISNALGMLTAELGLGVNFSRASDAQGTNGGQEREARRSEDSDAGLHRRTSWWGLTRQEGSGPGGVPESATDAAGRLQKQASNSSEQPPPTEGDMVRSPSGSSHGGAAGSGGGGGGGLLGLVGLGGVYAHNGAGGAPPEAASNSVAVLPSRSSSQQIGRRPSNTNTSLSGTPAGQGDTAGVVHGAFHELDVFTPLAAHLQRLWTLWEMTLLGRALMVVAPTPGETSTTVAALLALVAPLPYALDFRPYFCIHDTAFARLAAGVMPGPEARDVPSLIGVTNLYFIRALPHWPNILSVGKREGAVSSPQPPVGSLAAAASAFSPSAAVQALRQRTQGASVLLSGHSEALWASYKPLTRPDQALLARLLQPKPGDVKSKVQRIAYVNSDAIRRHFGDLTAAFLAPFARYFEPGPEGRVPGWNSEEFLFGLRSGQLQLAGQQVLMERLGNSTAALVELYARFTSSLNFAAWFAARRRPVAHLIAPWPWQQGQGQGAGAGAAGAEGAAGTEGDTEAGMASWFASASKHLDEVKLIGLFFSTEQQLAEAQAEAALPDAGEEAAASVARLGRELALLFFSPSMPEDMALTCISSPARRALLEGLPLTAQQRTRLQQLLHMLQQ